MDLGSSLISSQLNKGEIEITVDASNLVDAMGQLRDNANFLFSTLMDVTAVDYPSREVRYDVVYHMLSMKHNQRIRVKVMTSSEQIIPSVTSVWNAANWFEREVWDMYGLMFSGHPDLRRLLSDYGFDGHPLRKDFPLTGHVEVRYDSEQGRVVYEPVKLQQEYRTFEYSSPWEGMMNSDPLPGDEKATKEGGA